MSVLDDKPEHDYPLNGCWERPMITTPVLHENIPLLEVADAETMELLLADATVAGAVIERLSPTVAVLDPSRADAVINRLLKLGHLPKVSA